LIRNHTHGRRTVNADQPFFSEWDARSPGDRRSLDRARLLTVELGIADLDLPILTIVGSKGKGTAAAYASAYLSAAGRRVVTITSPSYRSTRERIRVDGRAISEPDLRRLSTRVAEGIGRLPDRTVGQGYLAPSGLFIVAGMLHALSVEPDVIVLEAGRGGRSDEACLFQPTVTVVTPIFEEHIGELGASIMDIARDKASVIGPETAAVLSAAQGEVVERVLRTTVAEMSVDRIELDVMIPGSGGIPGDLLPAGLGTVNGELGCLAAQRLLDVGGPGRPTAEALRRALSSVRLPGRLSWHRIPGTGATLLLDQAINRAGAAAALAQMRARQGGIDHVVLSLSDDKDVDAVIAELDGLPVTFVHLSRSHLSFTHEIPSHWTLIKEEELTLDALAGLGPRVLASGTFSFVALMLGLLDVETERLFIPWSDA
jgi:folylpolyglutamate synthase/dihydrofolate synthase